MAACPPMHNDGSLPLSDRLSRIEAGIERLSVKFDERLKPLEDRVVLLERDAAVAGAVTTYRRWVAAMAAGILVNTLMLAATVFRAFLPLSFK